MWAGDVLRVCRTLYGWLRSLLHRRLHLRHCIPLFLLWLRQRLFLFALAIGPRVCAGSRGAFLLVGARVGVENRGLLDKYQRDVRSRANYEQKPLDRGQKGVNWDLPLRWTEVTVVDGEGPKSGTEWSASTPATVARQDHTGIRWVSDIRPKQPRPEFVTQQDRPRRANRKYEDRGATTYAFLITAHNALNQQLPVAGYYYLQTPSGQEVAKQPYEVGERVERRNEGEQWGIGYVTCLRPLRVSRDDPLDRKQPLHGETWGEVRAGE